MAFRTMTCQTACHRMVVPARSTGGTSKACCPAKMSGCPTGCARWPGPWPRCAPPRCPPSCPMRRAARAAFREIMLGGRSGSAPPGGAAGDARTLILPARAADPGPHVVARPRPRHAHRRPPRRGRWGARVLVGAAGGAAAVVIVGGIALAGVFSGGNGHPGVLGRSSGATSAAPQATHPGLNGVEGTASKEPTASPDSQPLRRPAVVGRCKRVARAKRALPPVPGVHRPPRVALRPGRGTGRPAAVERPGGRAMAHPRLLHAASAVGDDTGPLHL